MRHGVGYRKFQKSTAHTQMMFRNMATSLLRHETIETTTPKAKELRGIVEKLITAAKAGDLAARRKAFSFLTDKAVVHKLFDEVAPRYSSRPGGYTRVVKTRRRGGDAADMSLISLVAK